MSLSTDEVAVIWARKLNVVDIPPEYIKVEVEPIQHFSGPESMHTNSIPSEREKLAALALLAVSAMPAVGKKRKRQRPDSQPPTPPRLRSWPQRAYAVFESFFINRVQADELNDESLPLVRKVHASHKYTFSKWFYDLDFARLLYRNWLDTGVVYSFGWQIAMASQQSSANTFAFLTPDFVPWLMSSATTQLLAAQVSAEVFGEVDCVGDSEVNTRRIANRTCMIMCPVIVPGHFILFAFNPVTSTLFIYDPLGEQHGKRYKLQKDAFVKFLDGGFANPVLCTAGIKIVYLDGPEQSDADSCGAFVLAFLLWYLFYGFFPTKTSWIGSDRLYIRSMIIYYMLRGDFTWQAGGETQSYVFRGQVEVRQSVISAEKSVSQAQLERALKAATLSVPQPSGVVCISSEEE